MDDEIDAVREIARRTPDEPPADIQRQISQAPRPCGTGRFAFSWKKGPARGKPMTVYCAEPLCLRTGSCTGPRFVPTLVQFEYVKDDGEPGPARKYTLAEAVAASAMGAALAAAETGVRDTRTEAEVRAHLTYIRSRLEEQPQ